MEQVAANLESHPRIGIGGNDAEIARRRSAFGANRYTNPPVKGFLISFVVQAFKDEIITILLVNLCYIFSKVIIIICAVTGDGYYMAFLLQGLYH